jgi:hypothetical protein
MRSERGQILVLAALFGTALLALAGLAIDGGWFYVERRQAQNAADHAAQAATHILADGGTEATAEAVAIEYAEANGYGSADVVVNIPPASGEFAGLDDHVEVIISKDPTTFFIHTILSDAGGISARGVATYEPLRAGHYALFAKSSNCGNADTLEISGSNINVDGYTHANANVKIPGSSNDFVGEVTRQCGLNVGGSDNTFDPAPPPAEGTRVFPVDFVYSDFPCTMEFTSDTDLSSVPAAWVNDNVNTNQLKPGVYCSTAKLTLSRSDVSGSVTLVAQQELSVSGSNFALTPYWNDVLLFTSSTSSSALDVNGSGGSFTGLIIAPNGNAKIQGSNNLSIRGSVLANTISVSGSDFSLTALEDISPTTGKISLVE